MYQTSFSRQDLFQVCGQMLVVFATAVLLWLLIHPLAGVFTIVFFTVMLVFVSDMVAKDMYEPPLFRCNGCGKLKPESRQTEWDGATLCSGCDSDKPSQKEFALSIPMAVKRLRKS